MAETMMDGGALFKPFDLRGITLKNRIVMSPLTRSRAGEAHMPNALMAEYYKQRASAGLIITEGTFVSKQAIGWLNAPGIHSDAQAHAWRNIVDTVHAQGTPIFLQLWHCGRASHSGFHPLEGLPVCGYTMETAQTVMERNDADLISFGRPFISNPDLVERFANVWPLNPPPDMKVWYSFDEAGYTDFPAYQAPVDDAASSGKS